MRHVSLSWLVRGELVELNEGAGGQVGGAGEMKGGNLEKSVLRGHEIKTCGYLTPTTLDHGDFSQ